jgi:hypothetical protein
MGLLLAVSQPGGLLGGLTFRVLAAHIALMLGAWVTPMLTGVAYRLVGMFTLSEDRLHPPTAWAELALTAGGAWLFAAAMLFGLGHLLTVAGAAAVFLGFGLFAGQLVRLYRRRRRRTFDIHTPFIVVATGSAVLALGLILFGLVSGRPASDSIWRAAVWLLIVGWAETAIQGFSSTRSAPSSPGCTATRRWPAAGGCRSWKTSTDGGRRSSAGSPGAPAWRPKRWRS